MKKYISILIVVIMFVSMMSPVHVSVKAEEINLLKNGSFEDTKVSSYWVNNSGAQSWAIYPTDSKLATLELDTQVFKEGSNSIKLSSPEVEKRADISQDVLVTAGKVYKFSTWIKTESVVITNTATRGVFVRVQYYNSAGKAVGNQLFTEKLKGTNDWTYEELIIKVPTGVVKVKIEHFLETATGIAWFDDSKLVELGDSLKGLSFDKSLINIEKGSDFTLNPIFDPENAYDKTLEWTSDNDAFVSVENGVVNAKEYGAAVITAKSKDGGYVAECTVVVGKTPGFTVDSYNGTVDEDSKLKGKLQVNGVPGDEYNFKIIEYPKNGKANIDEQGNFNYYPNKNYSGDDTLKVYVSKENGEAAIGEIDITVNKVNDLPNKMNLWWATKANTKITEKLVGVDEDEEALSFSKESDPENGTIIVNVDGTFEYTPKENFIGYDSFNINISDGKGGDTVDKVIIYTSPTGEQILEDIKNNNAEKQHPRLYATEDDFSKLRAILNEDKYLTAWFGRLKTDTDNILTTEPTAYLTAGRSSGTVKTNLTALGIMYQLTLDERYAERAWKELESVSAYPNWYPGENGYIFLSDLIGAVATGYDLVYNYFSDEQRAVIIEAIKTKGLMEILKWYNGEIPPITADTGNNINYVVNGYNALGALVVVDESNAQDEAKTVLEGVYKKLQLALRYYSEDGAWVEGPAYWGYGIAPFTYFMAAINNSAGTDYGLSDLECIKNTPIFPYSVMGENGYFNFSDGGASLVQPHSLWFAKYYNKPEYAWYVGDLFDRKEIYNPLNIVFYEPGIFDKKPEKLDAVFDTIETATFRSSWGDPNATFAAMKGMDSTMKSHADMDLGTFVFDALGERWAMDLGSENYSLPGFWNYNYDRWIYYRKKAEGHNTLVINPKENPVLQQDQNATSKIIKTESKDKGAYSILDLTDAYNKEAEQVLRGMMLFNDRRELVIRDEIKLKEPSEIYWFMHTKADIEIIEEGEAAILTLNDRRLYVKLQTNINGAKFSVMDAVPLPTSPNPAGQSPNVNVKKLTIQADNVLEGNISVWMVPLMPVQQLPEDQTQIKSLNEWSLPEGEIVNLSVDDLSVDGETIRGFKPDKYGYILYLPHDAKKVPEVSASGSNLIKITQATKLPGTATVEVSNSKDNIKSYYYVTFRLSPYIGKPQNTISYNPVSVTASAQPEANVGNIADKTIDGDFNTKWTSEGENWIMYDLGEVKRVGYVSIAYGLGDKRNAYLDIEVSNDEQNWNKVFRGESSGITTDFETFSFNEVNARYVRLITKGNSASQWNNVTEVEILANIKVTGIELNKTALTITEGNTEELVASISPENAFENKVTWHSDNNEIVSVDDNGKITALKAGEAKITVTTVDGGYKAECVVKVDEKISDIAIVHTQMELPKTGTVLDKNVMISVGILLIIIGGLLFRKKKVR